MLLSRITALVALAGLGVAAFAQSSANVPGNIQAARLQSILEYPNARLFSLAGDVSRIYGNIPMPGITAEDSAIAFMNMYSEALGAYREDLVLEKSNRINTDMEVFWFAQRFEGLPVEGSGVTVMVSKGLPNAIVLVSPKVRPVPTNSEASISAATATGIVKRAFRQGTYFNKPQKLIWAYGEAGRVAYSIVAGTFNKAKPEKFNFFVDANSGAILEKRSKVYFVDVNGTLKGYATPSNGYPDTGTNPPTLQNLVGRARVVGGNSVYAAPSGAFTIPNAGNTAVTVEGALVGQWVNVINNVGANEIQTVGATPPGPADIVMNPTPSALITSQVNGLVQTNIVHNYAKAINPAYPGIDIQINCYVNLTSTCNAYYDGNINFYQAGGGCANTAYSSVVHHEYGHFIIDVGHNNPSGDYHEGVADTAAILLANDPIVGRDFSGPGTQVRNTDTPNVMYPCSGAVHQCGLVIAGAFWDAYQALRPTMGDGPALTHARYLYLNQILMSPTIDPGLTIDVMTLDDAVSVGGDANATNGSPRYNEIDTGFTQHNLPAPALQYLIIDTFPTDATILPANAPININIQVSNNIDTYLHGTTRFFYKLNNAGPFIEVKVGQVSDNPFGLQRATIPAQPVGTLIEWYVSAQSTANHVVFKGTAAAPNQSIAANSLVTAFSDSFDTDLGWTVVNTAVVTGAWERAIPNTPTLNEPPGAHTPSWAYVTDNRIATQSANYDLDGGPTVLTSPSFDLTGNGIVSFAYYMSDQTTANDLLTVQISNNGGGSWTTVRTFNSSGTGWATFSFVASKYIAPTATMRIRLSVSDNPNDSLLEAGLDTVLIRRAQ